MKLTLRATLTSILVSLLLLTMGTFGYSFYRNARSTAADLSKQILDQNLLLIDFQINEMLTLANEQGATNVRLLQSGRFRVDNFPDLARYWLDLMEEHPRLTRLSLGLEADGEWFHVTRSHGKLAVGELRRRRFLDRQDGTLRVQGRQLPPETRLLRPRQSWSRPSHTPLVRRGQGEAEADLVGHLHAPRYSRAAGRAGRHLRDADPGGRRQARRGHERQLQCDQYQHLFEKTEGRVEWLRIRRRVPRRWDSTADRPPGPDNPPPPGQGSRP